MQYLKTILHYCVEILDYIRTFHDSSKSCEDTDQMRGLIGLTTQASWLLALRTELYLLGQTEEDSADPLGRTLGRT